MNADRLTALCRRHNALLLTCAPDRINIAVVDNPPPELLEALRFATQKRIDIECWTAERMEKHQQTSQETHLPVVATSTRSAIETLNHTLTQALSQRASDIHIEPAEESWQIRLRIDGVLYPQQPLPAELGTTLIARLKVLGNLDIAERRLPQDGQFTVELSGSPVSFRIATLPCRSGEKIVLRLLQQEQQALRLEQLGMSETQQRLFASALTNRRG